MEEIIAITSEMCLGHIISLTRAKSQLCSYLEVREVTTRNKERVFASIHPSQSCLADKWIHPFRLLVCFALDYVSPTVGLVFCARLTLRRHDTRKEVVRLFAC